MTSSSFSSKQLGSANLRTSDGVREDAAGSQGPWLKIQVHLAALDLAMADMA